jgi:hypothetical protein
MGIEKEAAEAKRQRLRAALDGVDLAPEATSDDAPESDDGSRDREFEANRPPHHG